MYASPFPFPEEFVQNRAIYPGRPQEAQLNGGLGSLGVFPPELVGGTEMFCELSVFSSGLDSRDFFAPFRSGHW